MNGFTHLCKKRKPNASAISPYAAAIQFVERYSRWLDFLRFERVLCPLVTVCAALALPAESTAQSYEDGVEHLQYREYTDALKQWAPLAEMGHFPAQWRIGNMHRYGQGVPKDYVKARKWYLRSAILGYGASQQSLGAIYEQGLGVEKDIVQAKIWYEKAAMQNMGWAQERLGFLYFEGRGLPRDLVKAHAWANISASWFRPSLTNFRDSLADEMAKDEVATAQRYARMLVEKIDQQPRKWSSESGQKKTRPDNEKPVLKRGIEALVKRKSTVALHDLRPLANRGVIEAQKFLGTMYSIGLGVPQDYSKALMWWYIATELGAPVRQLIGQLTQDMSESQLREARSMANDWLESYRQPL